MAINLSFLCAAAAKYILLSENCHLNQSTFVFHQQIVSAVHKQFAAYAETAAAFEFPRWMEQYKMVDLASYTFLTGAGGTFTYSFS